MVNEPSTFFSPAQNGINAAQLNTVSVHQNNITGPTSYTNDARCIKTSLNSQLSVRCNSTTSSSRGIDFNGSQPITTFEDNVMQVPHDYGFSLDNSGVIGTQGTSTRPTNNIWQGTWTSSIKTLNYNANSSASLSKVYVQWSATTSSLDPNGSSFTNATYGIDDYFHGTTTTSSTTLLDVGSNTVAPSCRLGGGCGGCKTSSTGTNLSLMEDIVQDSIDYIENASETKFINKNLVFRAIQSDQELAATSSILLQFNANSQNSSMKTFYDIENDLLYGDNGSAQNKISGFSPANNIEQNYVTFYTLLSSFNSTDSLSYSDSLSLITLANKCPFTEGGVVYQARALYNQIFAVYLNYIDNCPLSQARLSDKYKANEIRVEFNSLLFPNPNNGEFTIEANTKHSELEEVVIYDVTGQQVYRKIGNEKNIKLTPELQNGVYLVEVIMQNGTRDKHKLIISQ